MAIDQLPYKSFPALGEFIVAVADIFLLKMRSHQLFFIKQSFSYRYSTGTVCTYVPSNFGFVSFIPQNMDLHTKYYFSPQPNLSRRASPHSWTVLLALAAATAAATGLFISDCRRLGPQVFCSPTMLFKLGVCEHL